MGFKQAELASPYLSQDEQRQQPCSSVTRRAMSRKGRTIDCAAIAILQPHHNRLHTPSHFWEASSVTLCYAVLIVISVPPCALIAWQTLAFGGTLP